ncbi:MAG: hypothetical protein RI911_308 [Candidatus Parcubacteria bacterium]|jgi:phosphoribosylglycinamide formyltransferase-1
MQRPTIVVFASGTKDGGGSGFQKLVEKSRGDTPELEAIIGAVVSQYSDGGVAQRAAHLSVPFIHFPGPYTAEAYGDVLKKSGAQWVALSGWLKKVSGLDPKRTFNIHPGSLTDCNGVFGGKGMYGHYVHEAVAKAYGEGKVKTSSATMHFVTDEYDRGPIFFEHRVDLAPGITAEEIGRRVNELEHAWQARITNLVVHEHIAWDGADPESLVVPEGYMFKPNSSSHL